MVGLVVVSHSLALAEAAVALSMEMVHDERPRIAIAAGIDGGGFGTDAIAIKEAVEKVDSPDGVVVLMDLGSAVLSSELALDLVDPEVRDRVHLISAPIVEGLIAAVVQVAAGEPAESVIREAMAGLYAKETHLGVAAPVSDEPAPVGSEGDAVSFEIRNPHGLHARPAARLVAAAKRYDAEVSVRNLTTGTPFVSATSLSRVVALGALQGHTVEAIATGRQKTDALDSLTTLAARSFDEHEPAEPVVVTVAQPAGQPLPGSPGVAIGQKWSIGGDEVEIPDPPKIVEPTVEWRLLRKAVAGARGEIVRARTRLLDNADEANAAIFDAHLMLLDDDDLLADVRQQIDNGEIAARAWQLVMRRVEHQWAELDDPYLNARAADVRAVSTQVLRQMFGADRTIASQQGILVAADLTPNDTAQLDTDLVQGFVTAFGSPTSHSAILARALGLPAVVAAGRDILDVPDGTTLIVDGTVGTILIDPAPEVVASYEEKATKLAEQKKAALGRATQPAATTDGVHLEIMANIGSVADVGGVVASGGDGVGLLRSEFLFLDRSDAPTTDEQEDEYRQIAAGLEGRRLTIRTLDIGGDKPLRYLPQPAEANPFLGLRGIRLSLANEDLFRSQLTAILRVAIDSPISVMFPMISTVNELGAAIAIVDEVAASSGGRPPGFEVGMMVEVPAVATNAAAFTPLVDFVSIGTNDLTQYTMAAERGNQAVAHLADPLDPAVLQLIARVVAAAGGKTRVAVCGEAAADVEVVPVLLGLGVDELSVTPFAIPTVKDEVRSWSGADARQLAQEAVGAGSAAEVRGLVGKMRGTEPVNR